MGISCRTRDFRFKAEMEIGFKTRVFVQKASNKPLWNRHFLGSVWCYLACAEALGPRVFPPFFPFTAGKRPLCATETTAAARRWCGGLSRWDDGWGLAGTEVRQSYFDTFWWVLSVWDMEQCIPRHEECFPSGTRKQNCWFNIHICWQNWFKKSKIIQNPDALTEVIGNLVDNIGLQENTLSDFINQIYPNIVSHFSPNLTIFSGRKAILPLVYRQVTPLTVCRCGKNLRSARGIRSGFLQQTWGSPTCSTAWCCFFLSDSGLFFGANIEPSKWRKPWYGSINVPVH